MSFFSGKLKDQSRTQIVTSGMTLDELLKEDILKELKEKFADQGELITSVITFHIEEEPKSPEPSVKEGEKKRLTISLKTSDFVELNHPSPQHHKNKIVVITANRNATLEKFLK